MPCSLHYLPFLKRECSYSIILPLPRRTYFWGNRTWSTEVSGKSPISSEVGPGGESYNSVMLPRSFICTLSCPLFPVICFPSWVWRQIYPSNLQNSFCSSFVKSLVLFLHPPDFLCTKTTFAFSSVRFPLSHPGFKPSFSKKTSSISKSQCYFFHYKLQSWLVRQDQHHFPVGLGSVPSCVTFSWSQVWHHSPHTIHPTSHRARE